MIKYLLSLSPHQLKCVREFPVNNTPACHLSSLFEEYKEWSVVTSEKAVQEVRQSAYCSSFVINHVHAFINKYYASFRTLSSIIFYFLIHILELYQTPEWTYLHIDLYLYTMYTHTLIINLNIHSVPNNNLGFLWGRGIRRKSYSLKKSQR